MGNKRNKVVFCVARVTACLALIVVWTVLAVSGSALAANNKPDKPPGGGKKDSGGTLTATFCVRFLDEGSVGDLYGDSVRNDFDSDDYCNSKKDKLLAMTGSGPGFRLDTNTGSKFGNGRMVLLDFQNPFDGRLQEKPGDGFAEIDMRFIKDSATKGGLDLGALVVETPGFVSLRIAFVGEGVGKGFLVFGEKADLPFPGCSGSNEVTVKRLDLTTWTIESTLDDLKKDFACLNSISSNGNFVEEIGRFYMPFLITLEQITD